MPGCRWTISINTDVAKQQEESKPPPLKRSTSIAGKVFESRIQVTSCTCTSAAAAERTIRRASLSCLQAGVSTSVTF